MWIQMLNNQELAHIGWWRTNTRDRDTSYRHAKQLREPGVNNLLQLLETNVNKEILVTQDRDIYLLDVFLKNRGFCCDTYDTLQWQLITT